MRIFVHKEVKFSVYQNPNFMADTQEFLGAVVKVKTMFSIARTVVVHHKSSPPFKAAFMRLFCHAKRKGQIDCILNSGMSLRFVSIIEEMLEQVRLTQEEWTTLASTLCNRGSSPVTNYNKIVVRIVSSALRSKRINADDLFGTLVPSYASFEHPDLCRLVLYNMQTPPTSAQKRWAFDNLDEEIAVIIHDPPCYIHNELVEEEDGEENAPTTPPELRTTTMMGLVSPFIRPIILELCKNKSVSPDLFIALRKHFPTIFVFQSSLANTIAIGVEDIYSPQLCIRDNCTQVVVGADTTYRASDIIRQLLNSKHYVAAKWLLRHIPYSHEDLMSDINTHNNYQLELIGHQTGIPIARDLSSLPTLHPMSLLWTHVFDVRTAAHNIRRLPELLLMGERLLIREYGRMCVWPPTDSLQDGRVFALWEAIVVALRLANPTATGICERTWEIVCQYSLPDLNGDISLLIALDCITI